MISVLVGRFPEFMCSNSPLLLPIAGDAYRDGMVDLLEEWINGETVVSTGTVAPRFSF